MCIYIYIYSLISNILYPIRENAHEEFPAPPHLPRMWRPRHGVGWGGSVCFHIGYRILDIYIYISVYVDSYVHTCIGGWGVQSNREVVSCRACVRAVGCKAEMHLKRRGAAFAFPFCNPSLSLFPCEIMCFPFPLPPTSPPNLLSSFGWRYTHISS